MDPLTAVNDIAKASGGTATLHQLKNEHGEVVHAFATMSMPLRPDHWIYQKAEDGFGFPPPMPLKMGSDYEARISIVEKKIDPDWLPVIDLKLDRRWLAEMIRAAGKYAVRSATMHGSEMDFDPDALLQNLVVGFLGYWTKDGLGSDEWENPKEPWAPSESPDAAPPGSASGANSAL